MLARGAVKLHSPEQKKWLIVAACHAGTLADNRTPVGSGRFRDLPKTREASWADLFLLPCSQGRGLCCENSRGQSILLLTPQSFLVLLVEERMSQVASTALEREIHFCPGLAVEPVSHRRKDRNSCDFSFRFHEWWSSGAAASDGSNSVSIFGAGWTRTKYSRPISSCRIGSGNISASRAYCERCAAIAAIFCWT